MKRKNSAFLAWCTLLVLVTANLSACAPSPTQNVVTSKNDGAFDISVLETAPDKADNATEDAAHTMTGDPKYIQYTESFTSTDGSVEFSFNIDQDITDQAYPVVEVRPHMFTNNDAQTIASVLFGKADFYEAAPTFGEIKDMFSKAEMRASIQRWSSYTNEQMLLELLPNMANRSDRLNWYLERIKGDVADFSTLLEELPETNPHAAAKWEFQPDWKYLYSEENVPEELQADSDRNEQICVTTTVENIPYRLDFTTNNGDAYKLNTIFAYPGTVYSPMDIDRDIFRAKLCRTDEPTAGQIEAVKEKAQTMLNHMGIGTWAVGECYVENTNTDEIPEYVISLNAVPVFEGAAAMYRTQLDNLSENFAASYYLTEALFQFSANGDLVYLRLSSPVDIVDVINKNVATMNIDELMERAKKHLMLSDYNAYGLSGQMLEDSQKGAGEDFVCKIELSNVDYGLIRVKAAGDNENYYYIPGMIIYGSIDYCGKDSGTVYVSSDDSFGGERIAPLVALNAIDGSIINLSDG